MFASKVNTHCIECNWVGRAPTKFIRRFQISVLNLKKKVILPPSFYSYHFKNISHCSAVLGYGKFLSETRTKCALLIAEVGAD